MTLDQSLANLQHQADRLANLFAATADAIEARTGAAPLSVTVAPELARAVSDGFATRMMPDTPAPAPQRPSDWDHTHEASPNGPELVYHGEGAAVSMPTDPPAPQQYVGPTAPQGASPSSTSTTAIPTAGAVEVEGPGVSAPETPRPAAPVAEAPPWTTQAEAAPVAAPAKKGGRRTNDELAAEIGVDLEAVKKWKGGGRISKNDMEEYKLRNPEAVAPAAAPLPAQVSDPMGAPQYDQSGMLPAAAPAQGPPQEWPVAQPVEFPAQEWPVAQPVEFPAQEMPYANWPAADETPAPAAEWKPFG